ncbi:VPDSG-CTERM sorting domain-containing protein [Pelagicoccus sp. SDUM812005]|uniref:VPDSG-CTERM sorting domain-containing protein n=1 Tax=Pelagicoccus sp. SDUM812005 TaxID=3041257 RepID=UPI00280FEF23|nr:VPDSG-CTERM sorting domain-containing protein [Pelagicoccus sp. SDUM812005]MDQ8180671.1 VPDSG-CTERM sorting domain-containing protein [Pelagicoccus sp. SDUM812005]
MKKTIITLFAALTATVAANAIAINIDDRLVGIYGREYDTRAIPNGHKVKATGNEHLDELVTMLGLYNTTSTQIGYSIGTLASGSAVPAPLLPVPTTHFLQASSGPGTPTLTTVLPNIGSLYLGLKSANEVAFYYLGGLSAGTEITVTNANDSKDISNWSYYGTALVPDSGTTLALLGAALFGLIGFRRFKK